MLLECMQVRAAVMSGDWVSRRKKPVEEAWLTASSMRFGALSGGPWVNVCSAALVLVWTGVRRVRWAVFVRINSSRRMASRICVTRQLRKLLPRFLFDR